MAATIAAPAASSTKPREGKEILASGLKAGMVIEVARPISLINPHTTFSPHAHRIEGYEYTPPIPAVVTNVTPSGGAWLRFSFRTFENGQFQTPTSNPEILCSTKIRQLTGVEAEAIAQAYRNFMRTEYLFVQNYVFLGGHTYVGEDPEIFVVDEHGVVIPAFDFLPHKDQQDGKHTPFADGYQAEVTPIASACHESLTSHFRETLRALMKQAKAHNPDARLSIKNVVDIPGERLANDPEIWTQLGCAPSQNIYGLMGELVGDPRELMYRFAGGHKHYGIGAQPPETIAEIVKAMDAIYSVPMVAMAQGHEDTRRRRFYGLPGEYRLPKHGLEYRVGSNFDNCDPRVKFLSLDVARSAMWLGKHGWRKEWDATEDETINIVRESDVDGAKKVIERNLGMFKAILTKVYTNTRLVNLAIKTFMQGPTASIGIDVDAIEHNWRLDNPDVVIPRWRDV